jgi:predicted nucleic acid-binding protein
VILLDTNVLLYATGGEHALREPARRLLGACARGSVDAFLTDIVLTEFVHARARRSDRPEAIALAFEMIAIATAVIALDAATRERALRLYEATPRLSINDATIAAVTRRRRLPIATADRDFDAVAGLEVALPDAVIAGL